MGEVLRATFPILGASRIDRWFIRVFLVSVGEAADPDLFGVSPEMLLFRGGGVSGLKSALASSSKLLREMAIAGVFVGANTAFGAS